MPRFTESDAEFAALEWLQQVGYTVVVGPDIAPGGSKAKEAL